MNETADDTTTRLDYASYLLRLWREDSDDHVWRASLEDPLTGERMGFGSLQALFHFLQRESEEQARW
jgi:hypothetical protein